MADHITQHFRGEEAPFVESATGFIQQASDEYRPILTHFLNPRQQYILSTLVNRDSDLKMAFNGGYPGAEMCRGMIYPAYFDEASLDFELNLFEVDYPVKFTDLQHGQILGSMLGAGIDREVLGDIITDGIRWQVFTTEDMSRYIASQVDRMGKIKVRLKTIDLDEHLFPLNAWEEESTTLSSTRLDNVVATGFHLSRHHAKELIEAGRIQLNWNVFERPDYQLAFQDVISVRGFGRVRLTSVNGVTKKDKLKVTLSVLHK